MPITYGAGKDRSAHRVVDIVHDDTVAALPVWRGLLRPGAGIHHGGQARRYGGPHAICP